MEKLKREKVNYLVQSGVKASEISITFFLFFFFFLKTISGLGLAFANERYQREGTQVCFFFMQTCPLPFGSMLLINAHH